MVCRELILIIPDIFPAVALSCRIRPNGIATTVLQNSKNHQKGAKNMSAIYEYAKEVYAKYMYRLF